MFKGIATALITPLNKDLTINESSFINLCKNQSENGVKALFVHGTTGSGSTLSIDEKIKLLNLTHENVSSNVKIFMSISNNDTISAKEEIKIILKKSKRVDGMLLLTPYYNKANEIGMLQHLKILTEFANLPTILYHIPGRCGIGINYNVLKKLYNHPLICGIKYADDNLEYLQTIILEFQNKNFKVYLGEDALYYVGLKLGIDGLISASTNILLKQFNQINLTNEKSKELFLKILPLVKSLFLEVNPICVTYAYHYINKTQAYYRLPLSEPTKDVIEQIIIGVRENDLCD